jgi:DinB superfamily
MYRQEKSDRERAYIGAAAYRDGAVSSTSFSATFVTRHMRSMFGADVKVGDLFMTQPVEVWLRGPVEGIPPLLQPAAHTLLQVGEDVLPIVQHLTPAQLWARPGGAAAIGFHLAHLPGSLERLLTYSRSESLSTAQLARLAAERTVHEDRPPLSRLLADFSAGLESAIGYLRGVAPETLLVTREVGRKRLPSTTLGLIFHAAEHSSRHAGQIVTLTRVVQGLSNSPG